MQTPIENLNNVVDAYIQGYAMKIKEIKALPKIEGCCCDDVLATLSKALQDFESLKQHITDLEDSVGYIAPLDTEDLYQSQMFDLSK